MEDESLHWAFKGPCAMPLFVDSECIHLLLRLFVGIINTIILVVWFCSSYRKTQIED